MNQLVHKIRMKELKSCFLYTFIILVILSIGVYVFGFKMVNYYSGANDYWDLYDQFYKESQPFGIKSLENSYVELDVDLLMGSFEEEYKNDDNTADSGDSYYYIFPVSIDDDEYMVVKTRGSNDKEFWDLAQKAYAYYMEGTLDEIPDSVSLKGGFEKLPGNIKEKAKEYLSAIGDVNLSPFMLEAGYMGGIHTGLYVFVLIGSGILFIALAARWIRYACGTKVKKLKQYTDNLPLSRQEELYNDYEAAKKNKKGGILYGDKWIFLPKGRYFRLASYHDLVWMYAKDVKHRTNGIPPGTTRSIIIYDKNKNQFEVGNGRNSRNRDELFETIRRKQPSILCGYSDEMMNTFHTNFSQMIEMACTNDMDRF